MRRGLLWLLLYLGLCTWWRADYVSLLGIRDLPISGILIALGGTIWVDVLIAFVLVSVLSVSGGRGAVVRWSGRCLVVIVFAWICTARLADRVYFFYSGDHVDQLAIEHFEGDAFGMKIDPRTTAYIAIASCAGLVGLMLLFLAAGSVRRAGWYASVRQTWIPAVALAFVGWSVSLIAGWFGRVDLESERLAELRVLPEARIPALLLQRLNRRPPRVEGMFLLDPVVKNKLRRFGIRIDENKEYPLVKERVFDAPVEFAKTTEWTAKPNVIVLFFESFSTALTSVYGGQFPGLTPNLEKFAKESCVVEDFFNASTPTVTSLTCCYGSYLPVTNTQTWYLEENNSGKTRLHCLPHILVERGWTTMHVHSLTNEFVRTGEAVTRLGFQTVADGPAIGRGTGEQQAHWGYSDHQIFRFVRQQLAERKLRSPFLLSVATVDSHAPFLPSREAPAYARRDGGEDNPLLNSIHSADHAFGQFWDWFRSSEYFANTIVVVTADHAMFPGKEHAELRPDTDLANRYYDRVMFCLRDPRYELVPRMRIVSSQLDITPTLLHLLDINVSNHFEGHSLFGSRRSFPGVIGMHEFLFGIYQTVDGASRLTNFRKEDVESTCTPLISNPATSELSRCEYFHFYKWKRALHVLNRVWPPQ